MVPIDGKTNTQKNVAWNQNSSLLTFLAALCLCQQESFVQCPIHEKFPLESRLKADASLKSQPYYFESDHRVTRATRDKRTLFVSTIRAFCEGRARK